MHRSESLDSIRGIAILLVAISHFFSNTIKYDGATHILGNYDINIGIIGRMGVMLFFFLSGFLIFHSLNKSNSIFKFYKKRILRIYPPYLFSIVFYLFISTIVFIFINHYDIKTYFVNMLMLQDIFGIPLIVGVYWTLLIEIKFYLIIPILVYLGYKYKKDVLDYVFIAMIILNILYMEYRGTPSWLIVWMPLFWIGIYLYKFLHQNSITKYKFLLLLLLCFLYFLSIQEFFMALFLILNISIFFIFYSYHIKNKYLSFIGIISYSFYLLHTVIGYPLLYLMTKYITLNYLLIKIGIVFLISIFISYLSFKYIERLYWRIK